MENKEINSHFIQKAMVKRWAINDRVSYVIHGTNKGGFFNPDDYACNQPIAIKGFYIEEIEKGINILEVEGDRVIKKILLANNEIILSRKEVVTLKFYFLLNSLRTELVRNMIKNPNRDWLLQKVVDKSKKTPKENQENILKILFQKYNNYKKDNLSSFEETTRELDKMIFNNNFDKNKIYDEIFEKMTFESSVKYTINLAMRSELIFVKFKEGELLLTEINGFSVPTIKKFPSLKYKFFLLSSNLGVLEIAPIHHSQLSNQLKKEYNFFSFDLDEFPKINFLKETEISKAFKEYFWNISNNNLYLNTKNFENEMWKFNLYEKPKFYTNKDKFIYQIHSENKEIVIKCNAKALINCNNSYVIYKSIHNYYDAIQWMKKNIK